ncbi:hypothetical protein L6164_015622 [Bauhinia variegata]|uniref:Uncharacterized protein n=1 Tax=Bauhinia variegata TaxID=167791 RepID=A0ACB9NR53_BAUVA|nr:hypothetical protein L6164_015622 [Bauhinia variegata]
MTKHRKIHLFDIDIPGKITFMESKTYSRGDSYHYNQLTICGKATCSAARDTESGYGYVARGNSTLVGPITWQYGIGKTSLINHAAADRLTGDVGKSVSEEETASESEREHDVCPEAHVSEGKTRYMVPRDASRALEAVQVPD